MAAFASSFLANPFEVQAQVNDSLGNIFNANGLQIGVVKGSVADVGSQGAMVSPTAPASSTAISPTSTPITASDVLSGAAAASGVIPYGGQLPAAPSGIWAKILKAASDALGVSEIENIVFIIVGLILIAGAVFSFKPARDVAVNVGRAAAGAAA